MNRALSATLGSVLLAFVLAGCNGNEAAAPPSPASMTVDAVGHNCQMYVLDHEGPKAQIHLKGADAPLWFAEVVDAVAYLRDQEQSADVTAVYVSDMAKARAWTDPGKDNWIAADKAFYVIDGQKPGGMGTPEAVPFGTREAASAYVGETGGRIVALADIPDDYLRQQAQMSMGDTPVNHAPEHGG